MSEPGDESPIAADERVVFFPTAANRSPDGASWEVFIHGWVFEPKEDSRRRAALLRMLGAGWRLGRKSDAASIFGERARAFLVNNKRGKRIPVRIMAAADQLTVVESLVLEKSKLNGHFSGVASIPAGQVSGELLRIEAITRADDDRRFAGEVRLLPPEGVSIISDIDDTLKISEVSNRRRLMRRTFTEEFEAVPGMARLYADWESRGADLHYVTAAPWQLFEPLSSFMTAGGFPRGTFHMKELRFKDRTAFNLFADADRLKRDAIEPLLARFPQRRFILIGDSGERDPEIYGAIARAHPGRIQAVFIRDVTGEPADSERYRAALGGLPEVPWRIFANPADIEEWRWGD